MSTGFRVFLQRDLPPKELLGGFKELPAANIADCMYRLSALSSEIRLMSKPFAGSVAGPALTVKARPGDNLMLHKALNMATEGDVIVVSNEGDRSQSLMGEVMAVYGKFKKVAAFVFDGPIRDIDTIYNLEVPIYATGTTPGGPFKDGPGEINVPISCGNAYIEPGDIILGDTDGVIVIPRLDAAAILEAARKFSVSDKAKLEAAYKGTSDRSWVEKSLESKGCIIIDAKYSDRSTFFCSEG
ncbi:methyltransferase [Betaproteobacteria bacterium]|nr:methyltransferase [Betaproteobacteria bacterium]